MDQQTALQQVRLAGVVCQAYERFLSDNVAKVNSKSDVSLDALLAKQLVKNKETFEAISGSLDTMAQLRAPKQNPKDFELGLKALQRDKLRAEQVPDEEEGTALDMGPVFGNRQIQNSATDVLGLTSDKELGERLKELWADCINCSGRPHIGDIDLSAQLKAMFQEDLKNRFGWLIRMEQHLNNVDPFRDLCDLLEFLNFMCLPDLVTIMKMLELLVERELSNLRNISLGNALYDIASSILRPYVMGLSNMLNNMVALTLAPVDCIVAALISQMEKIPRTEAARETLRQLNQSTQDAGHELADLAVDGTTHALATLSGLLLKATGHIRDRLLVVDESLAEILGGEKDLNDGTLDIMTNMKNIVRITAIIKTLIGFAAQNKDAKICQGEELSQEIIEDYVLNAISLDSPLTFTPAHSDDGSLTGFVIGRPAGTEVASAQGGPDNTTDRLLPQERFASFAGCMGGSRSSDVEKIQKWVLDLEKER